MNILLAPNPTGSGHNMRTYAIAEKLAENNTITVALESLSHYFTGLFKSCGCQVLLMKNSENNYSNNSNLSKLLDWDSYISGYISKNFINTDRILRYIDIINKDKVDVVISDYNISASIAGILSGKTNIFVTERYDFTITQVPDEMLEKAGFEYDKNEIDRIRSSLKSVFKWIIDSSQLVLTDKPPIECFDTDTAVYNALKMGNAHFTGPIVRNCSNADRPVEFLRSLGIEDDDQYIVASVGGTTMFRENKKRVIDTYLTSFQDIRKKHRNMKLLFIGKENIKPEGDIICCDYIPDWIPVIKNASLLLSAPGWITATEVSTFKIPVIYVLPDYSEYHEVEAAERLKHIGYCVLINPSEEALSADILKYISDLSSDDILELNKSHEFMAPYGNGRPLAIELINNLLQINSETSKVSRIILNTDGSTTNALESAFSDKITVKVSYQGNLTKENHGRASAFFNNESGKNLIQRNSKLIGETGSVYCEALVITNYSETTRSFLTTDDNIAIGKKMKNLGIHQDRVLISNGLAEWAENVSCKYKEYIINIKGSQKVYIFEKFNPDYI